MCPCNPDTVITFRVPVWGTQSTILVIAVPKCSADMETQSIMIQTGVCTGTSLTASVQVSSANKRHNPFSWSSVKWGQQKSFNKGHKKTSLYQINLIFFEFAEKHFAHSCYFTKLKTQHPLLSVDVSCIIMLNCTFPVSFQPVKDSLLLICCFITAKALNGFWHLASPLKTLSSEADRAMWFIILFIFCELLNISAME